MLKWLKLLFHIFSLCSLVITSSCEGSDEKKENSDVPSINEEENFQFTYTTDGQSSYLDISRSINIYFKTCESQFLLFKKQGSDFIPLPKLPSTGFIYLDNQYTEMVNPSTLCSSSCKMSSVMSPQPIKTVEYVNQGEKANPDGTKIVPVYVSQKYSGEAKFTVTLFKDNKCTEAQEFSGEIVIEK